MVSPYRSARGGSRRQIESLAHTAGSTDTACCWKVPSVDIMPLWSCGRGADEHLQQFLRRCSVSTVGGDRRLSVERRFCRWGLGQMLLPVDVSGSGLGM